MENPHNFDRDALLKCGQGEMFGIENAQLPVDPMLMFDRIVHISSEGGAYGNGEVIAELDINPKLWFFDCHFVGDPVMPGCLGLDALWQLLGFYLVWMGHKGKGRALGAGSIRFVGQVLPDHKLVTYHLSIKRIFLSPMVMGVADGRLSIEGVKTYVAKELQVGLFPSLQQGKDGKGDGKGE